MLITVPFIALLLTELKSNKNAHGTAWEYEHLCHLTLVEFIFLINCHISGFSWLSTILHLDLNLNHFYRIFGQSVRSNLHQSSNLQLYLQSFAHDLTLRICPITCLQLTELAIAMKVIVPYTEWWFRLCLNFYLP